MASGISEISCPICFEIFDFPKVLNCGHSFCETCILPVIDEGKLTCPECRRPTEVQADGLATNFVLNRLTEEMSGINLVTVVKSVMPPEMESSAKRIVWKAVNDNKDKPATDMETAIADAISEKFKIKYGKYWHCIVRDKNIKSFGFSIYNKEYICLEALSSRISLFKSAQDTPCWKCDEVLCDGSRCKFGEPRIDESNRGRTKDESMIEDGKRVVLQTLKQEKSSAEMADLIQKHFEQKYGDRWVCMIFKDGGTMFSFQVGFYISMDIGKLTVNIFKPFQV